METHVKVLAALQIAMGAFGLFAALILVLAPDLRLVTVKLSVPIKNFAGAGSLPP